MEGEPRISSEKSPPFRELEGVGGDLYRYLSKEERKSCQRKACAYLFLLLDKSQAELGDTDLTIILMPRSSMPLLDMRSVAGRANSLLPASDRCSCCKGVAFTKPKAWQDLKATVLHSNISATFLFCIALHHLENPLLYPLIKYIGISLSSTAWSKSTVIRY